MKMTNHSYQIYQVLYTNNDQINLYYLMKVSDGQQDLLRLRLGAEYFENLHQHL